MERKRIIVGAAGASGFPVLVKALELIREGGYESYLILSDNAWLTAENEISLSKEDLLSMADHVLDNHDMAAVSASGSFRNEGMLIVPCSMKTVAGIASGYSDNLLLRSADVALKEQRKLVLGVRECPLGPVHLRNLSYLASDCRASIMPLVLTFYNHASSVDDMAYHMAARLVEPFGIEAREYRRWNGLQATT